MRSRRVLDDGGRAVTRLRKRRAIGVAKPPYRLPTMAEVAALPRNGLRVISTFSGCGGSCLGFEMAGYSVLAASEFVAAARDTYRANHPGVPIAEGDVRQLSGAELCDLAGVAVGEVDVLEGSPPCASFSTAGKREAHWGQIQPYSDTKQRTDDLFFEFARLLGEVQPRAFVAENVGGLARGVARGYLLEITDALAGAGYRVEGRLLDAQWLGVPQTRSRLILVGVRTDQPGRPVFPRPLPYRYSLREALGWEAEAVVHDWREDGASRFWRFDGEEPGPAVMANGIGGQSPTGYALRDDAVVRRERGHDGEARFAAFDEAGPAPAVMAYGVGGGSRTQFALRAVHDTAGLFSQGEVTDTPVPALLASSATPGQYQVHGPGSAVDPETGEDISLDRHAIGREWSKLREGQGSDRYLNLVRPASGEACPTVTQTAGQVGAAGVTHPTQRRKFTLAELRALSSFPADFVLTGTYQQRWERIGRAVPPVMMAHVAAALRDELFKVGGDRGWWDPSAG